MEKVLCPLCQYNLTLFNFRQRDEHVNACLESQPLHPDDRGEGTELPDPRDQVKAGNVTWSVKQPPEDFKPASPENMHVHLGLLKQEDSLEDYPGSEPGLRDDANCPQSHHTLSPLSSPQDCIQQKKDENDVSEPIVIPGAKRKRATIAVASAAHKKRKPPYFKTLHFGSINMVVDGFCYGDMGVQSYFLTHYHSDHYGGLSKRWCYGTIYCTPETARLVISKLKVDAKYVVALEKQVEHTIESQKVRLLDANHCPGAAIILFNNNVLHTGDFRASDALVRSVKEHTQKLETLYLDTTYLDPGRTFPTQEFVTSTCAQFCIEAQERKPTKSWFLPPKPTRVLAIVGTYTIGKEKMAISIARALKTKIWASKEKSRILELLSDPDLKDLMETENGLNCQVHLASMRDLTVDKLERAWNHLKKHYTEVIAFCPTGWTHTNRTQFNLKLLTNQAIKRHCIRICRVPYSEHSSYKELENFCNSIHCRKIIPTVSTKYGDILRKWEMP